MVYAFVAVSPMFERWKIVGETVRKPSASCTIVPV
jgi:hypothetical protein